MPPSWIYTFAALSLEPVQVHNPIPIPPLLP
eukprot:CAMPEP_0194696938 /NCGR_PEP_ID=MMETSP0295-20121207/23059_1 /TAXON_ID=39354 /ORGANISM="Heterosigma akashiwo, Strain CCMP2393" /LENGTH=30 /DNA_ID= /DNA_START= /DNA_END= /DNA_ORIENTATION=